MPTPSELERLLIRANTVMGEAHYEVYRSSLRVTRDEVGSVTVATLWRRLAAELLGTAVLVAVGAGAVTASGVLAESTGTRPTEAEWGVIGIAFALALGGAIYMFGAISGAHFNPAVTLALASLRRFPWRDVVPYIVAQLIGGFVGALAIVSFFGRAGASVGHLGATVPALGVPYARAMLAEAVGTFILMLIIMALVVDERAPAGWAGLMIGLVLGGVIMALGPATGASLNPARTFGPYLGDTAFGGPNNWGYFPIYLVGPIIGAGLAALTYAKVAGLRVVEARRRARAPLGRVWKINVAH
jgi:glycerol uptake facilitator protein